MTPARMMSAMPAIASVLGISPKRTTLESTAQMVRAYMKGATVRTGADVKAM